MEEFAKDGDRNLTDSIVAYIVPSFHIISHACEKDFNIHYTPGAGSNGLEGPE